MYGYNEGSKTVEATLPKGHILYGCIHLKTNFRISSVRVLGGARMSSGTFVCVIDIVEWVGLSLSFDIARSLIQLSVIEAIVVFSKVLC